MKEDSLPHRFLSRFIATLKCRVCGEAYDPKRAELLGERDNALLVRLRCHRCGEQNTVALMQRTQERRRPIRDFLPGEWRRFRDGEPVSWDDVLSLHLFLASFDGDFRRLFSTSDTTA
jgi:hypothetical protein